MGTSTKRFTLRDDVMDYIEGYRIQLGIKSASEALNVIITQHRQLSNAQPTVHVLSPATAQADNTDLLHNEDTVFDSILKSC